MLEGVARQYGGKTAIAFGDRRLSYSELDEASNKFANALLGMGLGKGDRVVMLLSNTPEFVVIYFGIVKIGAIAVPLDTSYKLDELATLFNSAQPSMLVAESPFLEPLVPVLPKFKSIKHVIDLNAEHKGQFHSYQEIMATSSTQKVQVGLEADDLALIFYTSGPTSRPRGVMLSHENLIVEAEASVKGFEQTDNDIVVLFALPLYHAFGLEILLLSSLSIGSTVVMLPGLSMNGLMEAIERERATVFMGVPYIFTLAVNLAEKEGVKHDLSSLRLCVSGGSALSVSIRERFKQHYGFRITELWGLTEAVAHVTCQSADGTGKLGSVGKALSGWEVKIVDDNCNELPVNQPGEIIVRGPFMKGYYLNPEDTTEIIKDGWLYTGDIGRIDDDGEVFILGLKKDIILIKGKNIHPMDIEAVLNAHPKVAGAAVVGIPDEIRGARIRAVVSLTDGQVATDGELQEFCREHLANYKVPKQIVITDSLPKTATGEIRKEDLKQV